MIRRGDRLTMLETVREYALERLADDHDGDQCRLRLAEWCGRLAAELTPDLRRTGRRTALARLEAELPNALAELSWALDHGHVELLLKLLGDWGDYWWSTNRRQEGRAWFDIALQQAGDASDHARARALLYRARLADPHQHPYEQLLCDYEASLRLFRADNDDAGIATCLAHLSLLESWRANAKRASVLGGEAIERARRTGDQSLLAFVLALCTITGAGYPAATQRADTAIAQLQTVGDLQGIANVALNIGYLAIAECRYHDALVWLETALDAAVALDDPHALFTIRTNQGLARLFLDDADGAASAFCEALAVCRDAGDEDIVDETLLGLAAAQSARGEFDSAARLAGAAGSHETAERSPVEDAVWSRLVERVARARRQHGPGAWDRAADKGAGLTVHDAIALAPRNHRMAPASDLAAGPAPRWA